uniref:Uncharacterized protein n=1 Tax=Oryza rufipogon TaxID=4529 RepID=A0A0E0MUU0_ORYRU
MDSHDVRVRLCLPGDQRRRLASDDLGDPHQAFKHLAFLLTSVNDASPKPTSGYLDVIATTCMPTCRIRRAYSAAAARSTLISPSSSTSNTRAGSSAPSASC